MRKIVLILACVAMAVQAMGQAAPNRTWKTKVSDALGLMPAPDPAEYNRLMGDLLSTGSQGVDVLVSMFDGTNNGQGGLRSSVRDMKPTGRYSPRESFAGSTGAPIRK